MRERDSHPNSFACHKTLMCPPFTTELSPVSRVGTSITEPSSRGLCMEHSPDLCTRPLSEDFLVGPSLGRGTSAWYFHHGTSTWGLHRGTSVWDLRGENSAWDLHRGPLDGTIVAGPPHETFVGGPPRGTFTKGPSLASLLQGAFFS